MRQYEMTYLISDKVNDNDLTAATGRINEVIAKNGGKILGEDNWGRRKLAYPIKKQEFATYVTLNLSLSPDKLSIVSRELRLSKEIVRYLLVVKDYGKEELKLTADEIAETEDIEEVVGGDRSFEAVQGETEESYDLMAKRTEEGTEKTVLTEEINEEDAQTATPTNEVESDSTKEEKVAKKTSAKKNSPKTDKETQSAENIDKPSKKAKAVKKEIKEKIEIKDEKEKKAEEEADRLAKLDEEIEGILGDDL